MAPVVAAPAEEPIMMLEAPDAGIAVVRCGVDAGDSLGTKLILGLQS